ncbi:hypothetical protein CYJ44_011025 [Corynebacterium hesseae]|uniref:SPOR domain-containing protein n=1 Tax=Corynebacterium hesseae TaxID=2913502 RepID=A0ABU9UKU7_9CORY|nr:hypothetical protein CYJ44_09755 [Corynebacterium aurimucosum]
MASPFGSVREFANGYETRFTVKGEKYTIDKKFSSEQDARRELKIIQGQLLLGTWVSPEE